MRIIDAKFDNLSRIKRELKRYSSTKQLIAIELIDFEKNNIESIIK